jgi:adenylosuccinate synthase
MSTQPTCKHPPSQKEFALFDNQTDIVNTVIYRQNKRKQNNQIKATHHGIGGHSRSPGERKQRKIKDMKEKEFSTKY